MAPAAPRESSSKKYTPPSPPNIAGAGSSKLRKRVIFGSDNDPYPDLPSLDDQQAGVLVEVVKDLLYQVYVRKGRLQQAMMMRRFFADESLRGLAAAKNSQSGGDRSEPSPPRSARS